MNTESYRQKTSLGVYVAGLLGTLLIVGFLVRLMQSYAEAPSISATRAAERLKILTDYKAANEPLVENYDWTDQGKGLVRVPLERAKELFLEESKDPVAARSNLVARAAKLYAPAPKPPEKKNEYE